MPYVYEKMPISNHIFKHPQHFYRQLRREAKRNKNRKAVKEYPWLNEPRSIEILPILPSNSMVRNKCEFTFGYRYIEDENGSSNTVEAATEKKEDSDTAMKTMDPSNTGDAATKDENSNTTTETKLKKIPSLGAMARGWCGSVSHPRCSRNIPSEAVAIVDCMEEYLADCPMPPYEGKIHRGFWRQMTIRSSRRTNECMIIIVHAPTTGGAGSKDNEHVDNYDDVFESEKQRLVTMLTTKDLPVIEAKLEEDNTPEENVSKSTMKVTSIFFQEFDGLSHPGPDHPVQVSVLALK